MSGFPAGHGREPQCPQACQRDAGEIVLIGPVGVVAQRLQGGRHTPIERGRIAAGREPRMHAVIAGIDPGVYARGRCGEEGSQPLRHGRLADAEGLDRAHGERRQAEPVRQPRPHLLAPHAAHLGRHARHERHDRAVAFDPPARRGADRIGKRLGRRHQHRLAAIGGRHRAKRAEALLQLGEQRGVFDRLFAQGIGEPFAGQIVVRRTQAAGRQDDRRASQPLGEGVAQDGPIVGQHPDRSKRQAERRQLPTEEGGVRVDGLAEEELGADGEQLDGGHSARV